MSSMNHGHSTCSRCLSSDSSIRFPKSFTARQLEHVAGIKIIWTSNLLDHLLILDDDERVKVHIFHQVTLLENNQKLPKFVSATWILSLSDCGSVHLFLPTWSQRPSTPFRCSCPETTENFANGILSLKDAILLIQLRYLASTWSLRTASWNTFSTGEIDCAGLRKLMMTMNQMVHCSGGETIASLCSGGPSGLLQSCWHWPSYLDSSSLWRLYYRWWNHDTLKACERMYGSGGFEAIGFGRDFAGL